MIFSSGEDWNLEPTWRMNTNIPPPIRTIKKRNDEKVDFDCPDRGRDSADRIVAYQQDDGLRYRSRNGRSICGVWSLVGIHQVLAEIIEITKRKRVI